MNTPEQLKQTAAALLAAADGKEWQWKGSEGIWCDSGGCSIGMALSVGYAIRPKPEPKTRGWSQPSDVPLNCWLRWGGADPYMYLVCQIDSSGVTIVYNDSVQFKTWEILQRGIVQYSTDRIHWAKCEVAE